MSNSAAHAMIRVIYDGDCPICQQVALKRQVENRGHELQLVDARSLSAEDLAGYRQAGLDLNDGMIVEHQGQAYYGHDAFQKMIELSRHHSPWVRGFERCYQKLNFRACYRLLVWCRLLLLKVLGVKPIE